MDYNNVQLTDNYERDQNILEPLNFDTFLLEISCNIKTENLTAENLQKEFDQRIKMRTEEAKEIFKANLQNILKTAKAER